MADYSNAVAYAKHLAGHYPVSHAYVQVLERHGIPHTAWRHRRRVEFGAQRHIEVITQIDVDRTIVATYREYERP